MSYMIDGKEYKFKLTGPDGTEYGFDHCHYSKLVFHVADGGIGRVIRRPSKNKAFCAVFFKPNNGVVIDKIEHHTEIHNLIDDTYDNDVVHEVCTQTEAHSMLSDMIDWTADSAYGEPAQNFDNEVLGAFLLGYEHHTEEYMNYEPGTTNTDGAAFLEYFDTFDESPDIEKYDTAHSTVHYWSFEGQENDLQLKTFGANADVVDDLSYFNVAEWVYRLDEGESTPTPRKTGGYFTILRRKTPTPQAITHIVAFDDEYRLDSENMPSKFYYTSMVNTTIQNLDWGGKSHDMLYFEIDSDLQPVNESPTQINGAYKTSEVILGTFLTKKGKPRIKSLLLYVDSFFAIFRGHVKEGEEDTSKSFNTKHLIARSIDKTGDINDVKLYGVALMWDCGNDVWKELYATSTQAKEGLAMLESDPEMKSDYVTKDSKTIPLEHRWIEQLKLWNNEPISRYTNIVKFVKSGDNIEIGEKMQVLCAYARYTGYWARGTYGSIWDEPKVYWRNNKIPTDYLETQFFSPIFKPWAECELVVYCGGDGQPFSPYEVLTYGNELDARYGRLDEREDGDDLSTSKRKRFHADASEADNGIIFDYFSALSPFRTEMFFTHGGRREYDEQRWNSMTEDQKRSSKMGQCAILYARGQTYMDEQFNSLHQRCAWYNDRLGRSNNIDMSIILRMVCCFGGAIQQGIQRNILRNALCRDPKNLLNCNNMIYSIGATGTITGIGNSHTGSVDAITERQVIQKQNTTYKECADNFNNIVNNIREKGYRLIEKFYNDNYELMLDCLVDQNDRQMWDDTRLQIQKDLNDNGEVYFCTYEWDKTEDELDYLASDNYFDPETKKYPIHAGFIGYIKRQLVYTTMKRAPNPDKKIILQPIDAQQKEKDEFYSQFEPIGEKPNGRPVYSPEDEEIIENHKWSWDVEEDENGEEIWPYCVEHEEEVATESDLAELSLYWKTMLLDRRLSSLKTSIDTMLKSISEQYETRQGWFLFTHPIMGYCGKFATFDGKIMRNPNVEEDRWLTSDDDLLALSSKAT